MQKTDAFIVLAFEQAVQGEICGEAILAGPDAAFEKTVSGVSSDSGKRLLFWVRPTGVATFNDAKALLATDTPYGFEPADADWVLQSASSAGSGK